MKYASNNIRNILIAGHAGSGKTTLLKAAAGLLPHTGQCLLNGVPLESLSTRRLAQTVSYIPQQSGISVSLSAREVVLMGFNPRLGVLQSPTAAMRAAADEALRTVGLANKAGQDYLTLSGGEKQRISIARALLKDAPILILDDSVSAVDTRTEKIILDNLKKSRAGKTTLLIAHRISTVEGLDKIIFLEDGRVEAVGPHDQLYASCPEYHKMVDLQKLEDEVGGGNA